MHRLIMGNPTGVVDHIAHSDNPKIIDNRKSNLRLASHANNSQNSRKPRRIGGVTTSIFKGVTRAKRGVLWQAQIRVFGKRKYLGLFAVEAYAAYAYDTEAVKHFGEFALTNFPIPGSSRSLFGGN